MTEAAGILKTLRQGDFLSGELAALLRESATDMISDMKLNKIDTANLTVDDLGMFADTTNSMKLLTMHKAKGREFDAVAIIDLHDGKVPDYRAIRNNDTARIEEGRRLLYVAITRAQRLVLYATAHEHPRNTPSRFLGNQGIELCLILGSSYLVVCLSNKIVISS